MPKKIKYVLIPLGLAVLLVIGLQLLLVTFHVNAKSPSTSHLSLIIGTTRQITTLDPAELSGGQEVEIFNNIGSGLLIYDPLTSELVPGLAASIPEINPNGLVYTFTLRSGLKFMDGTPLNANAVKWSIDRAAALGSGMSYLVTDYVQQINVIDNLTVQFVLKQAFAFFPQLVVNLPYFPVSSNCFPIYQFDPNSTCGGIGPYTIANWEHGVSIELIANPNYYGTPPSIPDILVRQFNTAAEMRQALEADEIDVAWKSLDQLDYQEFRTNPDFNVVEQAGSFIRYLCINTKKPPFDNANLRVALAVALDRETTAHSVYSDTRTALYSMVPTSIWSHQDSFRELYGQRDLELARNLLWQEGYSETNKLEMELWYPLDHYGLLEPQLAARLASDIEETGMVSVTLKYADWYEYISNLGAGKMPVFLLGWWPDYPDPDNLTWPFGYSTSSSGMGINYNNPVMDGLLEAGRLSTPIWSPAREAIYGAVQELWAEEAPTIPLVQDLALIVTQPILHGISVSPSGNLFYSTIYWYKTLLPLLMKN